MRKLKKGGKRKRSGDQRKCNSSKSSDLDPELPQSPSKGSVKSRVRGFAKTFAHSRFMKEALMLGFGYLLSLLDYDVGYEFQFILDIDLTLSIILKQ